MIKRILFAIAIFCFLSSPSWSALYGPYTLAEPIAIDGDTINTNVPVWPGVFISASIRVLGVDTPELTSAMCNTREENETIKLAALAAKAFTEAWLKRSSPITIRDIKADTYSGRYDAVVIGHSGERLSAALISASHGRTYSGGRRQTWCQP